MSKSCNVLRDVLPFFSWAAELQEMPFSMMWVKQFHIETNFYHNVVWHWSMYECLHSNKNVGPEINTSTNVVVEYFVQQITQIWKSVHGTWNEQTKNTMNCCFLNIYVQNGFYALIYKFIVVISTLRALRH